MRPSTGIVKSNVFVDLPAGRSYELSPPFTLLTSRYHGYTATFMSFGTS